MAQQWMYQAFGQEFGPISLDELKELVAQQMVSGDSDVRPVDSSAWVKACTISELGLASLKLSDPDLSAKGADDWYYFVGGTVGGPVTFDELLELASEKRLGADDQVMLGTTSKWRRVGSIGRLVAALPFEAGAKTIPISAASVSVVSAPVAPKAPKKVAPKRAASNMPAAPVARQTVSVATSRTPRQEVPVVTAAPVVATPVATAPSQISDDEIRTRVREALFARGLPGLNRVDTQVDAGVVTLRGERDSEGERLLAVRIAEQTEGVVRVADLLVAGQVRRTAAPVPIPRSAPVIAVPKRISSGPGLFTQLMERVKGEHRNHAIAALVAVGVLGFWFFPRGPVRPVAVYPVKGSVVLDGQPLANAAIVLHRVGGNPKTPGGNLHPRGKAKSDGTFALETFDPADGAPEGEFVATVFLTEETEVDGEKQAGPNMLPDIYSRPETSPFKIRITASTKELQPLVLTKG